MTATLASIARDENYLHLTVTPTPVEAPEDYFPNDRRYYRWDVVMPLKGIHPSIPSYVKLMDHINDGYGKPVISALPLHEDAGVEVDRDTMFSQSIYVEATDWTPCPGFVEDGSCIHSDHTR